MTPATENQLIHPTTNESPELPESTRITVIEPAHGWSSLHLHELLEYRDLLYFMVRRDLKTRYTQTALGPLWIVIGPLMSMFLYTLVFGIIAKLPTGGTPYTIFSYAGLLPWDFFNDSVSSGVGTLLNNRSILAKVYFPHLLIPISQIISSLVDFCIAFVILLGMMVFYRLSPNWTVVFLPIYMLIVAATGVGFGLWFSGVVVKYRDFGNVVGYIMRAWMYASPVVYSIEVVPAQWQTLYQLNPMTNVLLGFRYALLGQTPAPNPLFVGFSAVFAVVLLVSGVYHLKRVERNIIDIA